MNNHLLGDAEAPLTGSDIAVVGMAGRFPGARSVAELWQNVRDGVESITRFTDEELRAAGVDRATLRSPNYVKSGAVLADMEMFDAAFFGISARDAAIMDPQHRHFLECVWEALESAGHTADTFPGLIGILAGSGQHTYLMHNLLSNPDLVRSVGMFLIRHTGNDKDFLTTRASYLLNLTGPSVNIQTACSTSLVAIHVACQSLLNGECDLALAGGVTIEVPHRRGYEYHEGEILSPDGHCRAFDARSQGTIFGSGVGIVVLRRLADAMADGDTIHAIVKSTAINNDGSLKAGYLAPSVDGQARAVVEALALAGVEADSISYVEAHGTGTPVGDPIEIAALTQAFRSHTDATGFCGVGSIKTNIGHLDTAAGVASFIKVVKALEERQLPPSLNFSSPNPAIDLRGSPFYVNTTLAPWKETATPRRAGVNSLGVGGTNAFAILEQAPSVEPSTIPMWPRQLLVLSARSESALETATANLAQQLRQDPTVNLADVASTLQVGRKAFEHRRIVVCRDARDAAGALNDITPQRVLTGARVQTHPSIVFMFPGAGAQYPNMARELYETEPRFRAEVDTCLDLLRAHYHGDLKRLMLPGPDADLDAVARELEMPSAALPALFIIEYALAKLWMAWGIQPTAMTGHSMGEYAAAYLSGTMTLDEALSLVARRGALFEVVPGGAMLSVRCSESTLRPLLGDDVSIAAINAPELGVASGPTEALGRLEATLRAHDIEHRRLKISVAAHSQMLDPILDEFYKSVSAFRLRPPTVPWMSNLTGTWITPEQATDPHYWVRHLREPVRFSDGISRLLEDPNRLFLEVGPGQTLISLVRQHLSAKDNRAAIASTRHPQDKASDVEVILSSLGRLWLAGASPDWSGLHVDERRHRVELPTYPFERQRYWIEPGTSVAAAAEPIDPLAKVADLDDWFYRPTWARSPAAHAGGTGQPFRWLVFRDDRGLGDRIVDRLALGGHQVISVSAGPAFARHGDSAYTLNPESRSDYDALYTELAMRGAVPQRIVHLWSVGGDARGPGGLNTYASSQSLGFYSLLSLSQVLGAEDLDQPVHIGVVSDRMHSVEGDLVLHPERATILGPCKVIPRELLGVACQNIDVVVPDDGALDQLAEQIIAEVTDPGAEPIIALRGQERWVERFEAVRVEATVAVPNRLREQGVYLITGGLGGIGLVQAEHLARSVRARLVLVGRTGLPERDAWDAWLETHGRRDPITRQIRRVQAIEDLGAEVMIVRADVTDDEQMRVVVAAARERFGTINGVIHAAGVLNDGLIQSKAWEAAERVIAPKVKGALILSSLLEGEALDLFIMFSSTSAILAPAGQVDYVGANAFLNAFAHSRAGRIAPHTVALVWGVWQDVGMSARASGAEDDAQEWPLPGEVTGHPLLGVRVAGTAEQTEFRARYSSDDLWILNEHRIKGGEALIPGTGYLEIARAAASCGIGAGPVVLDDVFFISPLAVRGGEEKGVRIVVKQDGEAHTFTVESDERARGASAAVWREHARATITRAQGPAPAAWSLDMLRGRCSGHAVRDDKDRRSRQEDHLAFGPRWRSLRSIEFGQDEVLALLELPEAFVDDLTTFQTHPALLDIAAHVAVPLIQGHQHTNEFYVPFSCKKVRIWAALPRRIHSSVRLLSRTAGSGLAVFDVVILDDLGTLLIEIEGLTLKRVEARALAAASRCEERPIDDSVRKLRGSGVPHGGVLDLVGLGQTEGILPSEGTQVLDRILAGHCGPQVVASSLDLHTLLEQLQATTCVPSAVSGVKAPQSGERRGTYVAPRTDLERKLASFWQELLGLDLVGVHDDFFELGGYSLIAVRLFAKIKKELGVSLELDSLFQGPTIAQCAEMLAEELGIEYQVAERGENGASAMNGAASYAPADVLQVMPTNQTVPSTWSNGERAEAGHPPPARRSSHWSPLVPIQVGGTKQPFFCVHGAGGNVLIFRDLARRLGPDQPFYGLRAQGVDGKIPPLNRIEDMATQYLEAIRQVQPSGPYLLGGYSGGGVIAFEMAQQLLRVGEQTALLAFLDTFHPEFQARGLTVREHLQRISQQGLGYVLHWRKRVRDRQIGKTRQEEARSYLKRGLTVPLELREMQMFQAFHESQAQYHPSTYPGKILLLRASEVDVVYDRAGPHLGWTGLAEEGIDVREVPGNHNTLVLEPSVKVLVDHLSEALREAQVAMTTPTLVELHVGASSVS